ncbi:MAG TPA: alpha/beta fold hydrolase [Rudaea sp.]
MRQQVRYVTTADGVNLAWSALGRGLPLVKAATWLTDLQYDLESPVWLHWIRFLSEHFRCIRYDERGCGMSDRDVPDLSSAHWVGDLEAVVEAAGIDRPFALLGMSQGAATAIQYAVAHPSRVSHLILYGGYAVGPNRSDDPQRREMYRAVSDVVRLGWGSGNPAFRQLFTSRFAPGGTQAQLDWFNELCRRTTSPENAGRLLAARGEIDVRALLPQVRVPTLVLHADNDHIAPLAQGRALAAQIPGAQFVQLESHNHVLLENEPAWHALQRALLDFTGQSGEGAKPSAPSLTARERKLLALLGEGQSNAQIAFALGIAEKTVRNHFSNLYRKLGVRSRVEALVRSQAMRDAG